MLSTMATLFMNSEGWIWAQYYAASPEAQAEIWAQNFAASPEAQAEWSFSNMDMQLPGEMMWEVEMNKEMKEEPSEESEFAL